MSIKLLGAARVASRWRPAAAFPLGRALSTLPGSDHIFRISLPAFPDRVYLTLLPRLTPVTTRLALGHGPAATLDPSTFTENAAFRALLHATLRAHAHRDPAVAAQAAAFASSGGGMLGMRRSGSGAGGASDQGGMGGGGTTGYVHVADTRAPPAYGRIADPQDIFGSLEVDGRGAFVDGTGCYEESGTYRVWTPDGCLGLTPYLRERLGDALNGAEKEMEGSAQR